MWKRLQKKAKNNPQERSKWAQAIVVPILGSLCCVKPPSCSDGQEEQAASAAQCFQPAYPAKALHEQQKRASRLQKLLRKRRPTLNTRRAASGETIAPGAASDIDQDSASIANCKVAETLETGQSAPAPVAEQTLLRRVQSAAVAAVDATHTTQPTPQVSKQAGDEQARDRVPDNPCHPPQSRNYLSTPPAPSSGGPVVTEEQHLGFWLAALVFSAVAALVLGHLLHIADLWVVQHVTMPFNDSVDSLAGLLSSVMAHGDKTLSTAVSTFPDKSGLFPTVAGSCGFQLILAAHVDAVHFTLNAVGLSFRAVGVGIRAAVSWLFMTPASIHRAIASGLHSAIVAPASIVCHVVAEFSTAALDRLTLLISTSSAYLMSMATATLQATCSCLFSYPADAIKAAVEHLLSFPAVIRHVLYLTVVQPVALGRAGASCLASNTLLVLKAGVFDLLVYPCVAIRGGLSYMGASVAAALRAGVVLPTYGWAAPLLWSCLLPLAVLLVILVFWPEMQSMYQLAHKLGCRRAGSSASCAAQQPKSTGASNNGRTASRRTRSSGTSSSRINGATSFDNTVCAKRHDAADPSEPTPGSPITPADSSHLLSLTTRLRMFTFCVLAGSTGVYCLYTAAVWVISHVVAPVLLTLAASVAWSLGLVHSPSVQAVTIATMAAVVLLNKRQTLRASIVQGVATANSHIAGSANFAACQLARISASSVISGKHQHSSSGSSVTDSSASSSSGDGHSSGGKWTGRAGLTQDTSQSDLIKAVFGRPERDAAIPRYGLETGQDLIKPKLPELPALACGKGCVGMHNLRNNCYANAIIQCLVSVPLVAKFFLGSEPEQGPGQQQRPFTAAFAGLVRQLWSSKGVVAPVKFMRACGRPWSVGRQQDAYEFMVFILQSLQAELERVQQKGPYREELSGLGSRTEQASETLHYLRSRCSSVIHDVFAGLLQSTVCCPDCGHESHKFDEFLNLTLPLPKGCNQGMMASVQELFKAYTAPEHLEFRCGGCHQKLKASKQLSVYQWPQVLVLHLGRFTQDFDPRSPTGLGPWKKNSAPVAIPETLQLPEYSSAPAASAPRYELNGVTHHAGSMMYGHCWAQCKSAADGQWYSCNDSNVQAATPADERPDTPYVLFYTLQTS